MNITITDKPEFIGIRLGDMRFGQVVTIGDRKAFYLVTSPMDGSGRKFLVSLGGGKVAAYGMETIVIPVKATLHIEGAIEYGSAEWQRVQAERITT